MISTLADPIPTIGLITIMALAIAVSLILAAIYCQLNKNKENPP